MSLPLHDFFFPPGLPALIQVPAERSGVAYTAAQVQPRELTQAFATLAREGGRAVAEVGETALLAAWTAAVEAFLDPGSPERQALDPALVRLCRLSPAGLAAGLEAVLGGMRGEPAAALLTRARAHRNRGGRPVLAILASNLPALAVQPLLPALALGRPVLLKSPSREPLFTPAFLAALVRREPRLAPALAAATWPGGDRELEAPLLARAATVLAYGGRTALADLAQRLAGCEATFLPYGPKTSLAILDADADPAEVAPGVARDIALFDQRGCLSIAAIYTAGDPHDLARQLAGALQELAGRWPAGPAEPGELGTIHQLRLTAAMAGLPQPSLPLAAGTVIVDQDPAFRLSPGRRTVRIHPLADLGRLPPLLAPWKGRLQGAALAGAAAWDLVPALTDLGISRLTPPGELQSPDASWHNGGVDPLAALA